MCSLSEELFRSVMLISTPAACADEKVDIFSMSKDGIDDK